jgi:hypothetical protein
VRSPRNAAEEWPIELINGEWYLLTWENTGWRTKVSRRLNDGDQQNLCLGWFNITDAEHPDYHPLFAAPQGQEEETMVVEGVRLKLAFCTTCAVCVPVLAQGPSFLRLRRALLRQKGIHKMRGVQRSLREEWKRSEGAVPLLPRKSK